MKILYVTTVGLTMIFFKSIIKELTDKGVTVDIACNDTDYPVDEFYKKLGCKIYKTDCSRSPFSAGNVRAVGQIRRLVEENGYDIVHCHTPIAGICTRIACKGMRKQGLKVFYTAHGFHFFKGAPLKNWFIYYPIEKLGAHFTDTLITINTEDYKLAESKMKAVKTEYIPGVGIDVEKFRNTEIDRKSKRTELGIPEDAFLILSVGELNLNKNHSVVIEAISKLKNKNIYYCIAGTGTLEETLKSKAKQLGLQDRVFFLGYRNDVAQLYKAADVFVLPSLREGLNVSLMEAIASGIPVICNFIRGNVDLVINSDIGQLCESADALKYAEAINRVYMEQSIVNRDTAYEHIMRFDKNIINDSLMKLYGILP